MRESVRTRRERRSAEASPEPDENAYIKKEASLPPTHFMPLTTGNWALLVSTLTGWLNDSVRERIEWQGMKMNERDNSTARKKNGAGLGDADW